MNNKENYNIIDTLYYAEDMISKSDKYGITPEVVVYSLKHMKENPGLTIEEALLMAYNEWYNNIVHTEKK
jgi:hypothetical protein